MRPTLTRLLATCVLASSLSIAPAHPARAADDAAPEPAAGGVVDLGSSPQLVSIGTPDPSSWTSAMLPSGSDWTEPGLRPALAASGDGKRIVIVTVTSFQLNVGSSTDGGATWSAARLPTTASELDRYPDIAMSTDGTSIVVAYLQSEIRDGVQQRHVQVRRSTDGGASWLAAVDVSTGGATGTTEVYPRLAMSASGVRVAIAWADGDGLLRRGWFTTSGDGGASWATPSAIGAGTTTSDLRVAMRADGSRVAVSWYRTDSTPDQAFVATGAWGGALSSVTLSTSALRNTYDGDYRPVAPAIGFSRSGALGAAWVDATTNARVRTHVSSDGGTTWGTARTMSPVLAGSSVNLAYPSIAGGDASRFVVGWIEYGGGAIDPISSASGVATTARTADGGVTWSAPVRPGENIPGVPYNDYSIEVGMSTAVATARVVAVWTRTYEPGNTNKGRIHTVSSTDGGATWLPAAWITPAMDSDLPDAYPSVVVRPDGSGAVAGWIGKNPRSPSPSNEVAQVAVFPAYRLTYLPNGADGGVTPPPNGALPGATVTIRNEGSMTRTGSTFTGWNDVADGSGTPYSTGDTVTLDADMTLHAQWDGTPDMPGPPTLGDVPSVSTGDQNKGSMLVTWPAARANGHEVTGYTLQWSSYADASSPITVSACGVPIVTTSCLVPSLYVPSSGTQAVYFRVRASNDAGNGPWSAVSAGFVFPVKPSTPRTPRADPTTVGGRLMVTWTPPASDGGAVVDYYRVNYWEGSIGGNPKAVLAGTCAGSPTASGCTIDGLLKATSYYVTIQAHNAGNRWSDYSTATVVSPNSTIPDAPAKPGVSVVGANVGDANVAITPPQRRGSDITSYSVARTTTPGDAASWVVVDCQLSLGYLPSYPNPVACFDRVPASSFGQTLYYRVAAVNGVGRGAWSPPSDSVQAVFIPGQPDPPAGSGSDGTVRLSWRPPQYPDGPISDGGSPITGYAVMVDGTTVTSGGCAAPVDGTTCTFVLGDAAIADADFHSFDVAAINAVGQGAFSWPSTQVSAIGKVAQPAQPTLVATPGANGSLTLSWTAPAGSPSGYDVSYGTTNNASFTAPTEGTCVGELSAATRSCTIAGVYADDGLHYALVTAVNEFGRSPASPVSGPAAPSGALPGSPVVTATRGNASVILSWPRPAENGWRIATYAVSYSTSATRGFLAGSGTCAGPETSAQLVVSCTQTGLVNGTAYYFRVSATNTAGTSTVAQVGPIIPATTPSAPASLTATGGSLQVALTWTAPSATGGSAVSGYAVQSSTDGVAFAAPAAGCVTPVVGLTCTVTGLAVSTRYWFRVAAINGVGTGPALERSASTFGVPSAPAGPTLTATTGVGGSLTATWVAPASNGSTITGYDVRYGTSSDGAAMVSATTGTGTCAVVNVTGLTCSVTGVLTSSTYYLQVRAKNASGVGPWSPSSAGRAPTALVPAAPTGLSTTPGDALVAVSWLVPAFNGAEITSYTVTRATTSGGTYTAATGCSPTLSSASTGTRVSCTATNLTNGTTYFFRVAAVNSAGTGAAATTTIAAIPGPPSALAAPTRQASNLKIVVDWAPTTLNISPVTGYRLQVAVSATTPSWADASAGTGCASLDVTAASCTVLNLASGTSYVFRVAAVNAVGVGAWSPASTALAPLATTSLPQPISGIVASALGTTSATISWTALSPAPSRYEYMVKTYAGTWPSKWVALTTTPSVSFPNLVTKTSYLIRVRAVNATGVGPYVQLAFATL